MPAAAPLSERLKRHSVVLANGCIQWTGSMRKDGYGHIGLGGKTALAHKAAYELIHGPVAAGMHLDHLCRNRACINPLHLEVVTHKENVMRGQAPAVLLHRSGKCKAGHPMSGSNLYISPAGRRHCRACNCAAAKRYKSRKAAA